MRNGVKNLFGVETIHSFGVIDVIKNPVWTYETEVSLERYNDSFYFRITVDSKAKGSQVVKGFPIKYSNSSVDEIDNAIIFLKQFDACWLGEIGDIDPRGSISRFIDKKILKRELVGYLKNIPTLIEDIYQNSLECIRDKHGEMFVVHQNKIKKSNSVITGIPRPTISRIIKVFEDYKLQNPLVSIDPK